jgi:hypothetical protein
MSRMLTSVLMLSALVAVQGQALGSTSNDLVSLVLAVNSTLESLKTGMSGAELTDALREIVAKADLLLAIYGYHLGEITDHINVETNGQGAGLVLAAALNGDLVMLSQYQGELKHAVGSGDSRVITEHVIGIRVSATRIITAMSNFNVENITYGATTTVLAQTLTKRYSSNLSFNCCKTHVELAAEQLN